MSAQARSAQSSKMPITGKLAARAGRPTILHVCAHLDPGDPARETVDLAVLTQRSGWRSLIASSGGLLVPEAERAAVQHTRMPLGKDSLWAGWRNRIRLSALIQKERPVLVHAHGIKVAEHALNASRNLQLPLVVDITAPPPDNAHAHRLMKRLSRTHSSIRVPSEFMAHYIIDTFKWPPQELNVIPTGIDLQWNNPGIVSAERLQALSKLWRLPEQSTVIVMPMPFIPGGGHRQLLEALTKVGRSDIFIVLVGDNRPAAGCREEIEKMVTEYRLDGKVIMPDFCLDWPAACWLANIVAATNTAPRGQGFELIVAQAIGRPVIVTDCGANKEMVQDGNTAWIVPPDDVTALTKALAEAINLDTAKRLDLAKRTRDFVAESFPHVNWFNSTMELYDTLLQPPARHSRAAAA
ncbi:MAG: glycosyltransferase [Bdellovibrionales bacterium]